ncbi:MAG: M48 family metallopeptidase [Flammeovirgaceae bacterium]|nr:M48 family metallopeptidase [Flammeovirgaceae bacterium]MDW8286690.1 M48 family metallopeptidase [Flammeovirgaceae bacterium]
MNSSAVQPRSRVSFPGIHPSAWQHPADSLALKTLKSIPGIDIALKTFFGATTERSLRLIALASAVRVNKKQFSRIHSIFLEACQILDIQEIPELYVSQNPFLNAGAVGMDKPFIVLNSALVESTSDEELMGVLGHELGHIRSGHVLYKSLLAFMLRLSALTLQIPLGGMAIAAIIAALKEWDRKSELSADRAELLVTQDVETSVRLLMKMAGGNLIDQMDLGEFIRQAKEYKESGDMVDNVFKIINLIDKSHPFPVLRVLELIDWVQSGEYDRILRGFYPREETSWKEDAKKAKEDYAESFRETTRPFAEKISQKLEEATEKAKDIFKYFTERNS